MLILTRHLDDGQAEDDGDEGQKRQAKPYVATEAALMQFMFLADRHHQPPYP